MTGWSGVIIWIVLAYVFFAIVTFGFLFRHGKPYFFNRIKQLGAALLWPLYWLIVFGVTRTMWELNKCLASSGLFIYYSVISIFFPAYYLYFEWGKCSEWGCASTVVKALLWAPFWPAYVAAVLTTPGP